MYARITKSFRIVEGEGTRKYTPGEVAEGRAAQIAIDNDWGKKINKAEAVPSNKAKAAAPKNKAG